MNKLHRSQEETAAPHPGWPALLREAQLHFGIKRFRPGQKEVLEAVFTGKDTLALMPTGAGKSLTYQLPALFLPKPVVVVSPLIALMQDQQEKAEQADVAVEKLDSTVSAKTRAKAEQEIADGIAQLVYVTPERLAQPAFQAELKAAGGISLLVVDEAHTIAQWGHDFRPAFLAIGEARTALGEPPVLALTATATPQVAEEILRSLHAKDATIINTGIERDNLFFSVFPTVSNAAKMARITAMIEKEPGTGIIYTASTRSADELHEYLAERGIAVARYHGKRSARDRERAQQEFMRGDHKVMIATKAFGLGIDKPDIRFVYHYEFPDSLETYYQEAGRAGRDGEPARAALLYRLEDKRIQSFFLAGRYPKAEEMNAVYTQVAAGNLEHGSEASAPHSHSEPSASDGPVKVGKRRTQVILNLLREAGLVRRGRRGYVAVAAQSPTLEALVALLNTYVDRAASDQHRLSEMMHYAESASCRVQAIRAYFDEPEGEPCRRCDNCARDHKQTAIPQPASMGTLSGKPASHAVIKEGVSAPASPREEVTILETMHGTIHTTAPETLLEPESEAAFQAGDQVRHKRFGVGKVLDHYNDTVLVAFAKVGEKRLKSAFVSAA